MKELLTVLAALSCLAAAAATPGLYLAPYPKNPGPQQDAFCDSFSACGNDVTCVCSRGQSGSCGAETCTKCSKDEDCAGFQSCIYGRCGDPCLGRCGANTVCAVVNHKPICACFPDHTGDPMNGCLPNKPTICDSNAACPSDKICIGQICLNPCSSINCPSATVCQILNHTVTCIKKPPVTVECTSNEHCALQRACVHNNCIDLCAANICGDNAICYAAHHNVTCISKPIPRNYCVSNKECPSDKKCVHNKCHDPCEEVGVCPKDAVCNVVQHTVTCISFPTPGSCISNENCASDETCLLGKCVDPCENTLCESNLVCRVINHKGVCLKKDDNEPCTESSHCKPDKKCEGNKCIDPCKTKVCESDSVCEVVDHEAKCVSEGGKCQRSSDCPSVRVCLNNRCIDPCKTNVCGKNAICKVSDNVITCISEEISKSNCTIDNDCDTDKACIDGDCVNPCLENGRCNDKQNCMVTNHLPICVNKENPNPPSCKTNNDCKGTSVCQKNKCVDICARKKCGTNAVCKLVNNAAKCACKDGFFGNADVECKEEGVGGNEIGDCSGNLFEKPIAPKKYYAVTSLKTDWHSAVMYCNAHGRRLAIVENSQNNEKILSEIRETEIKESHFWIGGTDNGFETKWNWMTTGLPITDFTYWHNYRPPFDAGRNCLEYAEFAGNNDGYKWFDGICSSKYNFICEDFE